MFTFLLFAMFVGFLYLMFRVLTSRAFWKLIGGLFIAGLLLLILL